MLAHRLLKGTGRRVGEVVSLRLHCLDVDEHGKDFFVYDNHKAGLMGWRLPPPTRGSSPPSAPSKPWVTGRFPGTPAERRWLLRPHKNVDGRHDLSANQLLANVVGYALPRLLEPNSATPFRRQKGRGESRASG